MFTDVVSKENSRLRHYNAELNDLILANTDGNQMVHEWLWYVLAVASCSIDT